MNTLIRTKPCYYCGLSIDINEDDHIRLDTLKSVLNKTEQAYAHELCDARAGEKADNDRAIEEYLDDQREYAGPIWYEEYSYED